jgi:hypothetical protein
MMKELSRNKGLTNSSCLQWKRHIMLPVQKTKLIIYSVELLYVECTYPVQGMLIEGTCFKFERIQETSIKDARREPDKSFWKTPSKPSKYSKSFKLGRK